MLVITKKTCFLCLSFFFWNQFHMDPESHNISQEPVLTEVGRCALCNKIFSPDNEVNEGFGTDSLCGDCKHMLLEDPDTNILGPYYRSSEGGRLGYSRSSESTEDLFSQQFSHLISLVRQNQHSVPISSSEHESQLDNGDIVSRVVQRISSRTTPSGSRRWRRVLSDNESEIFDNLDSVFGESESNVSFSGYGAFHSESDAISFSAYGGESDASVDGHGLLDREMMFIEPDDGSDIDSDTDIDPMHAGASQWNLDEPEDGEWEEADTEESMVVRTEGWIQEAHIRSPSENNGPLNWVRGIHSPESGALIRWSIRQSRHTYIPDVFTNVEDSEVRPYYIGNPGDYLDTRGFEELLEQLAENDSFRRGAPPASTNFVKCLPLVVINKEHEKNGSLVCAVCKDSIPIGTRANQLPCMHLYHPFCIMPWLSARNSCPVCRYELPTDDKEYEDGKHNSGSRVGIHEIQPQDQGSESSSGISSDSETDESVDFSNVRTERGELVNGEYVADTSSSRRQAGRGGWFFFAAAPIVSLVGIVLVLWFQNPLVERRGTRGRCALPEQVQQHVSMTPTPGHRGNRSRRWWPFF